MSKPLPPTLTSYDFLKATALLLMIIDHVGYYFFPEHSWMRIMGRFSAPIWLFLIGYARSRDVGARMWIGAGILVLSNYVVGMALLPINILGTIILCRLALDPVMNFVKQRPQALYPVAIILFFATFATFAVVEYGSAAMLIVIAGYLVRNREELGYTNNQVIQFAGIAALLYSFIEIFTFLSYGPAFRIGIAVGLLGLLVFLTRFRPYEYPALTQKIPGPFAGLIRLAGRRTLEFYVLHLLVFKIAVLIMGTHDTALFNFHMY